MELDLGFQGDLTIDAEWLENISEKSFVHAAVLHGIRGKQYLTKLYKIPEIAIGTTTFNHPILQANPSEFTQDSVFVQSGLPSAQEKGRIGWQLFRSSNLLIDVAHGLIALCDSLDTLKKQGYAIDPLAQIPLMTERGLLEFEAETSLGVLRCTLDTGASCNALHVKNSFLEEGLWKEKNKLTSPLFQIAEKDFGPITFRQIPIQMPIPIQAILGMEFFQTHLLFIDFAEGKLYIYRS